MSEQKYVVVTENGIESAILFHGVLTHSEVKVFGGEIVSAGFFSWGIKKDECGNPIFSSRAYGDSVSLGLKSRPEIDSRLIDRTINTGF